MRRDEPGQPGSLCEGDRDAVRLIWGAIGLVQEDCAHGVVAQRKSGDFCAEGDLDIRSLSSGYDILGVVKN
jgi:hypothetical protein